MGDIATTDLQRKERERKRDKRKREREKQKQRNRETENLGKTERATRNWGGGDVIATNIIGAMAPKPRVMSPRSTFEKKRGKEKVGQKEGEKERETEKHRT